MKRFMCTMVAGFEQLVVGELYEKLRNIDNVKIMRGKVLFSCNATKDKLLTLECTDNIYYYIGELKIGPHKKDLDDFYNDIKSINFKAASDFLGITKIPKIIVSTSKKGKQTYSRFEVSKCATRAIIDGNKYIAGDVANHNMPIRIDIENSGCIVSVQITPANFKYRGNNYEFMPGGIRPTIASALIRLGKPKAEDVFYDPFCGSGTIPRERARHRAKRIMASDINPVAVENARINLPTFVKVFCCDATQMKTADKSIDVIISNIPWGKQIAVQDIGQLYISFLNEAKRVLRDEGRMILLTDRDEIVEAANKTGFCIKKLYTISLHGLLAGVYCLT